MKIRPLLAIDVGASKVACAIGRVARRDAAPARAARSLGRDDHGTLSVLATGCSRYARPPAAWPADAALIAEAAEDAIVQSGWKEPLERAIVSLTHPQLTHSQVTAQIELAHEPVTVRQQAIDRLRSQAVSQSLGIDREVLWLEPLGFDGNGFEGVADPHGLVATRLRGRFLLVSIPTAARRAATQALESLGLDVERVLYSLPGIAKACLDPRELSQRVLLADLGGCSTDLALLERGRVVMSSTLPSGGNQLVLAVAERCRSTVEQALALSLEGLGSPRAEVRELVEAHLSALREGVDTLLRGGPMPEQAIVTGGGALIDGFVEWFQSATSVPARLGRSARLQRGGLSDQIASSAAIGALEMACRQPAPLGKARGPLGALVERTKAILTEYF